MGGTKNCNFTVLSFLATALPTTSDDIRDIRGPIHIPYPWLWIVYVLAGLAVCALLFWLYRWWKQRRDKKAVKLPHEIALEQLRQALPLMEAGQAREFSIAVSDAVRIYIESRFNLRAAHHTTEEFLRNLLTHKKSPVSAHAPSLENFLTYCDLAKFARWSLSPAEMKAMVDSGVKFVEETKPSPQEEAAAMHKKAQKSSRMFKSK